MDVLQEINFAVLEPSLEQIGQVDENESHEGRKLKLYSTATPPTGSDPPGGHECERTSLSLSSPLPPAEACKANTYDDSSHHAISLTSNTTGVSPWPPPEDCGDKADFNMMEPGGVSAMSGDCLLQQSRTCLGCFIKTKEATEPEPGLGLSREYDSCPVSDMAIQCMSSGVGHRYGDQLLSDQLLSYPPHKAQVSEKRGGKSTIDSDSEDTSTKSIYEGLLLDKSNGEEALLANSSQDWGCFESFISESKIELLDLCSKNELSVNLFTEEDVDNYMFDDEDEDSTLGSDVCSLKIRYESFQDNVREKTSAIQEETQFSFFPSVVAKKEVEVVRSEAEGPHVKGEKLKVWTAGEKVDKTTCSFAEGMPNVSPENSYLFELNNSTEDSGEYSDDSSCTGSSSDTCQTKIKHYILSRENFSSSSHLNYGLRSKRKVRYSEDYLYDVDTIENERNTENRDKQPAGLKKEEDDDWCPKKRRHSSRKEPPVFIKYIIINRFKGDKHMLVKLGKINTSETTVSLSKDLVHEYQRLAPLKAYWQRRRREMQEQQRLAAGDKSKCLNGCRRSLKSKYRIANRVHIQMIPAVEPLPSHNHHKSEVCATDEPVCSDATALVCATRLDQGSFTGKIRSQERERIRLGNKTRKIRKYKSEARLMCKKMKDDQHESDKIEITLQEVGPAAPDQSLDIDTTTAINPHICDESIVDPPEKSSHLPACCSPSSTLSVDVITTLPVIPGGYLQTLLDASDSQSNTGISYYPQEHSRQFLHGISQEDSQFTNLQLVHSCVLSPPSESELQQSPSNQMEQNFHLTWQSGADQLPFTPVIPPDSDITGAGYSSTVLLSAMNNMPMLGYSQVNVDNIILYDKAYLPKKLPDVESDMLPSQVSAEVGHKQLHAVTLNADNGRLVSYDSVGSLSVTSSNYTSLSLETCQQDSEEVASKNFLAHCSPQLVIQQSTEETTPLRESTDLLDISNFTPDKFRHSSVSEMSPPDTPNLSPQVGGTEMREGQGRELQETDLTLSVSPEGKWKCNINVLQNHGGRAINNQQLQFNTFNCEDDTQLLDKNISAETTECSTKAPKFKGKPNNKQNHVQGLTDGQRKTKSPRVAKTVRNKSPRHNSLSSKKMKALLQAKATQGPNQPMLDLDSGGFAGLTEDCSILGEHGGSWGELGSNHNPEDDDQREFEEPSNILSNIVSGMAEVQRFMKVSIEPLWDPMSGLCQPPEANSLKTKTLKILAGTAPDFRKKVGYAACPGAGRGRKTTGRGAKTQAKFLPSNPFFPPLTLDCNMSNLSMPGMCGPAHKKMYRHKTSAKFARDENTEKKDMSKNIVLMASYEKLR